MRWIGIVGKAAMKLMRTTARESLKAVSKRWRRFALVVSIIVLLSLTIPLITTMYFYRTEISGFRPILGEAWYLRISVGEPTEFTRIIEKAVPFWRYPIFSIEFSNPFAPRLYYTYENLVLSAILGVAAATLVCINAELASLKGSGVAISSGRARRAGILGALAVPVIQGSSVAYATVIGCSTCYGSLLIQITFAGLTMTITSTVAAYAGYTGFIAGILGTLLLMAKYSRDLDRLSSVRRLRL